ncbi:hypothetical protein ACP275_13G105600 [Erythranthe tilingii]
MNAIWLSLKEKGSCASKMTELAWLPEKMVRRKSTATSPPPPPPQMEELHENNELTDGHYYSITNTFQELGIGDPSRHIVEMIFRASSTNPKKCTRKIKRVLKVNNSGDTLAEFEEYRANVMKSSYKMHHRHHPRNIVDGNELLQFYGTTMICCCSNSYKTEQISQLCRDPSCRVCRVVQSGFKTCYNTKNGVRVSVNSEQLSEDKTVISKGKKKVKRAVIVCRTIAGRVVEDEQEECDSVRIGLRRIKSMILQNPAAVLPCFVIVFD